MTHKITLIPGDGIGPEVSGAAVSVISAAGVKSNGNHLSSAQKRCHGSATRCRKTCSIRLNEIRLRSKDR